MRRLLCLLSLCVLSSSCSSPRPGYGGLIQHTVSSKGQALSNPISTVYDLTHIGVTTTVDTVEFDPYYLIDPDPSIALYDGPGMDLKQWETQLDAITGKRPLLGRISYTIGGDEFFPRIEQQMRAAGQSILIRTYIFTTDDYALQFAQLLRERSADVEVKVMIDGYGTLGSDDGKRSVVEILEDGSEVKARLLANPFFRGDHTKTFLIDSNIAYLGGMNVAHEYRHVWHDMMTELRGPAVAELVDDFRQAWVALSWFGDFRRLFHRRKQTVVPEAAPDDYPLRLVYNRPGTYHIHQAQLAAIRNAKRYIYIQNPYFTRDDILLELINARRRGVDVRVILPSGNDISVIGVNNELVANILIEHGIRVWIYPKMSHVKAAVYDGWAFLGTANFDSISSRLNEEVNIATSDPHAVGELLERLFERDFASADELLEPFPTGLKHRLFETLSNPL